MPGRRHRRLDALAVASPMHKGGRRPRHYGELIPTSLSHFHFIYFILCIFPCFLLYSAFAGRFATTWRPWLRAQAQGHARMSRTGAAQAFG